MTIWSRLVENKRSDDPVLYAVETASETLNTLRGLYDALSATSIDHVLVEKLLRGVDHKLDELNQALYRGAGKELRRMYAPHCVKIRGNPPGPDLHESYSGAVRSFASNTLDALPGCEDEEGDSIGAFMLFIKAEDWARIKATAFDTGELEIHISRELTAVQDRLDQVSNQEPNAIHDEFAGYSKTRTKSDWLKVLAKLGESMGDDKFAKLRRESTLIEHPSTKSLPRAKSIRLRIDTLPPGYSDDLNPS